MSLKLKHLQLISFISSRTFKYSVEWLDLWMVKFIRLSMEPFGCCSARLRLPICFTINFSIFLMRCTRSYRNWSEDITSTTLLSTARLFMKFLRPLIICGPSRGVHRIDFKPKSSMYVSFPCLFSWLTGNQNKLNEIEEISQLMKQQVQPQQFGQFFTLVLQQLSKELVQFDQVRSVYSKIIEQHIDSIGQIQFQQKLSDSAASSSDSILMKLFGGFELMGYRQMSEAWVKSNSNTTFTDI